MAVPSTHTVAVGDFVTASDENTYVRDPVSFFLNPPRCSVYQGTTGTTAGTSGVAALVLWDSESASDGDTDSMHSTSSNTSRIVATTAGLYLVTVSIYFAANATGYREVKLRINSAGSSVGGTPVRGGQFRIPATATGSGYCGGATSVRLAATDYIEAFVTQTSGGSLATVVGEEFSRLAAQWVAA